MRALVIVAVGFVASAAAAQELPAVSGALAAEVPVSELPEQTSAPEASEGQAPAAASSHCPAEQQPEWATATAIEKRAILRRCLAEREASGAPMAPYRPASPVLVPAQERPENPHFKTAKALGIVGGLLLPTGFVLSMAGFLSVMGGRGPGELGNIGAVLMLSGVVVLGASLVTALLGNVVEPDSPARVATLQVLDAVRKREVSYRAVYAPSASQGLSPLVVVRVHAF